MGGCASKNKSKESNSNESESDSIKKPHSKKKGKHSQHDVSSTQPKNSTSSNGGTVNNDNNEIKSTDKKQNNTNSDVQNWINKQDTDNNVLSQPTPNRVISTGDSDSGLEFELANLVYGSPDKDYAENTPIAPTFKSTEV